MNVSSRYSSTRLSADAGLRLDAEFNAAVARGVFPGASLLIASNGVPHFERTWGRVELGGTAVNPSTRFDLASLTKPLVTAPLCMAAIAQGLIDLDDPLTRFFPPGSVPPDKQDITVKQLLSHSSGLAPYKPFYNELIKIPAESRRKALSAMILQTPLEAPPGKTANYSDLGFMVLGHILEMRMGGMLNQLANSILFAPQGINELHFCPILPEGALEEIIPRTGEYFAATQVCPWRKRLLFGEVDDENSWTLSGVAGHAGLFGTARGIFSLLSFLWNIYEGNITNKLLPGELVRLFWTRVGVPENSDWCLGYDTPSRKSSSAGRHFSRDTIGHLGFTGVSFWLDLQRGILVILLTNRVHPTRDNDEIRQFRPVLHDIIMEALINGK